MTNEIEFRGYTLENEFAKKQIIIKELVGNICDKYICAKVNNNMTECRNLSLNVNIVSVLMSARKVINNLCTVY